MNKIKKIREQRILDLAFEANYETGEPLIDRLKNENVTLSATSTKIDYVIIDSEDYFITDSDALTALLKNKTITINDLGYICALAKKLKTEYNAMFNHVVPYDIDSISEYLNLDKDHTRKMIARLIKKGVAYKLTGLHSQTGKFGTYYLLNPFLVRKRKKFHPEVTKIFKDFSTEIVNANFSDSSLKQK